MANKLYFMLLSDSLRSAFSMEFSPKVSVPLFIILVFAIYKIITRRKLHGKSYNYAPAPETVFSLILNFNRLNDYITEIHKKYKTYRVSFAAFDYVYTTQPENVEYILKSNFANYGKGKFHHDIMCDLLGDGIFAVDGELWKQQRKRASLEFSTKVLKDFSSVVFRDRASKLCKFLLDSSNATQSIEMQEVLMKSTMGTICKVGFNIDLDMLSIEDGESEMIAFAYAFDLANSHLLWRYVDPLWKLKRFFNIGSEVKMKEYIRIVDTFLYKIIRRRRREFSEQKYSDKPDLLSRFIQMGHGPEDICDKYLRDVVLNFIIAGRDTTAVTLCWFLYCICNNPGVEEKIFQEICTLVKVNKCGTFEESLNMFSEALTNSVLDKMYYLHATLSETLRLYPAVPVESKSTAWNDILPDGTRVKKGDMLGYCSYAMGRMTYLWGKDAEQFTPERWLNNEGIFQSKSPFLFTAFQAGPRTCLGKDFAYLQMKIIAATLIYFLKFDLVEGKKVFYQPSLTLHMTKDGLNLRIKPRSQL